MVVMGQGRGAGDKAFFKQWYGLHSPTDFEFTFIYQMIPHNTYRHVLHTLKIYGLQSITSYKLFRHNHLMGEN